MIDIKTIKMLVKLMAENDLSELDIKDEDAQISLKRGAVGGAPQVMVQPAAAAPAPAPAPAPAAAAADAKAADDDAGKLTIESPMVGSFYSAANPDSDPYVRVGTHVTPDSVVCIIEAMKVFNEIKAECSGTVEKILVNNGDAVEFGQPMYIVKPD